ncbi:MAG: C4-dicarboxylate ABC transporter, partial [Candidatus Tectomicrobia bacterium]|nr:C4-dicarboxylate ABC transporter [Candidatus Tectomicrobia bacterium]
TKTIQDNLATLGTDPTAAKGTKPEDALKGLPPKLSFHSGAVRYYKEKGLVK